MAKDLKIKTKSKRVKKCKYCKEKELTNPKQTYCSFKCADLARKERARNKRKGEKYIKSAKPEKDYLDELWYEAIKARAGYVCEYSKKKGKQISPEKGQVLNSHHLVGKPNLYLRYSLDNGMCITMGTHKFVAHQPSREAGFRQKVNQIRGYDVYADLEKYIHSSPEVDMYEVEARLKAEIEKYKGE